MIYLRRLKVVGDAKAFITTRMIEDAKRLVSEGCSLGYALGKQGLKGSQQEYLAKNSQAYRNLRKWYRTKKGLKHDGI